MPEPIELHGLTLDQANATAQFYSNQGGSPVVNPDGPAGSGLFEVVVTFPQSTDPNADSGNLTIQGTMSTFGGPNDLGVSGDEGLALVSPSEVSNFPDLFLPTQPPNTTGLARRLDPDALYLACRWEYSVTPISYLKGIKVKVSNPATGQSADARPVDWGPNISTGRVADLSPGLARTLGLNTDFTCAVIIRKPTTPAVVVGDVAGLPSDNPVPFAELPAPASQNYWPVVTSNQQAMIVSYETSSGKFIPSDNARYFFATRSGGVRHHVGVDVYCDEDDDVVACADGTIVLFAHFYDSHGQATNQLLIEHDGVVINYGEVRADSDTTFGWKVGGTVTAGQRIARIGATGMLHFESYVPGTKQNHVWLVDGQRPSELLNPTQLLLTLAANGKRIPVRTLPTAPPPIGANASSRQLARDMQEATKYYAAISEASATYSLPPSLICAIGSRESDWGLAADMRPSGPAGTGDWARRDPQRWQYAMPPDGLGWGRGLMQIDYAQSNFGKTGNWRDSRENILFGANELAGNIEYYQSNPHPGVDSTGAAIAAYNCGRGNVEKAIKNGINVDSYTTGHDYSRDVLARAAWFKSQGFDEPPAVT